MRGIVSPKLEPFLAQVAIGAQELKDQGIIITPQMTRANLEKLAAFLPQGPQISLIKDSILDAGDRAIKVRIYHPAPDKALPVLLHFHGGGHMCGSIELYDPVSRQLAHRTQSIVITIDYRLTPEYPYPCGLDDCQFALLNYKQLLSGLNYTDELILAGDSAGGALCSSLVMKNLQQPQVEIAKQILIYPSVDYSMSTDSIQENGTGYLLESTKIAFYFKHYFGPNADNQALIQKASPLQGPFTATMPATLIITAGCDPLRDEGNAYVKALDDAGATFSHHQFDDMIHAYMLLQTLVANECEKTYQLIEEFVR